MVGMAADMIKASIAPRNNAVNAEKMINSFRFGSILQGIVSTLLSLEFKSSCSLFKD
jgi:hypothetical protein